MNTSHHTHDYLCELNDLQRSAVEATSGPLMIVAGAGTGKTKTLTYRMYHLMKQGVSGRNILGITFTNKAASEMRERMIAMLGESSPSLQERGLGGEAWRGSSSHYPTLKTFHALGIMILRQFWSEAGIPKNFNVADSGDSNSLIKEAMQGLGIDPKMHDPRKIKSIISLAKNRGKNATEFESLSSSATDDIAASIWHRYEAFKTRDKVLDFDDLLIITRDLLAKNMEVRNYYQNLWQYIHVDEYQDTNQIQYEIVKLLVGERHNLCVVGDSDQNIYSWRGANLKNMLNFEKDFPEAQVIILEQNYRSTKNILDAASSVIDKNTARIVKNLVTDKHDGDMITIYDCMDGISEANMVAQSISSLMGEGASPRDIAVLYRTNFQSRIFEEVLLRAGIPYTLLGTKFFERKEIKDLVSYLKLAFNAEALGDLRRVINEPKRGLGPVALAKITAGQQAELSAVQFASYQKFMQIVDDIGQYAQLHAPSESVRYAMERSGLYDQYRSGSGEDIERLENLEELVTIATKYDEYPPAEGFAALLEECALHGDQDDMGSSADKTEKPAGVHLMTIHAAKGLEFDHVYIVGMEQGLFPHSGHDKRQSTEDREEERRLFYVAITRARKKLSLSYAHARSIFGQVNWQSPSEFLSDIPSSIIETITDWKQDQGDEYSDDDTTEEVGTVYLDW